MFDIPCYSYVEEDVLRWEATNGGFSTKGLSSVNNYTQLSEEDYTISGDFIGEDTKLHVIFPSKNLPRGTKQIYYVGDTRKNTENLPVAQIIYEFKPNWTWDSRYSRAIASSKLFCDFTNPNYMKVYFCSVPISKVGENELTYLMSSLFTVDYP